MYIVAIAWGFVVVLMSAAEATSTQGTLLGAFFTFVFYGVLPLGIVLYLMGTPARRKARQRAELAERAAITAKSAQSEPCAPSDPSAQNKPSKSVAEGSQVAPGGSAPAPDGGSVPAGDAVAPERKEA
jgi:hypothetical protein